MNKRYLLLRVVAVVAALAHGEWLAHAAPFEYRGFVADDQNGVNGLAFVLQEAISPDGRHLYAPGASDNAVAAFERDTVTGELSFVEAQGDGVGGVDGLAFASSVAVSPDGRHIYATGSTHDSVAVFNRSAATGGLSFVEVQRDGVAGVQGLSFARSVTVSPDGLHVYVAGQSSNSIVLFTRDVTTGALTFVTTYVDDTAGVDGLNGVLYVVASAD